MAYSPVNRVFGVLLCAGNFITAPATDCNLWCHLCNTTRKVSNSLLPVCVFVCVCVCVCCVCVCVCVYWSPFHVQVCTLPCDSSFSSVLHLERVRLSRPRRQPPPPPLPPSPLSHSHRAPPPPPHPQQTPRQKLLTRIAEVPILSGGALLLH